VGTDIKITPLFDWIDTQGNPFVIAGPCSAESEAQLLQTAREIAKIPQVQVFRAGIWKPRTRPGEFEGAGNKGLLWMQKVKEETGLKLATEVAKPEHVEKALEHKIDIIWLGARTVVNPFSVQEIAETLKGNDIPVLVKNPINPDLKLWLGAIERIHEVGISKMAAIHRGFHYFEKSPFRNAPMWEIPIELKRLAPTLPIITDPSHICGNRKLIPTIAQKALDFEMDGLMIESHINPKNALTDASQQLHPSNLKSLLNSLVIREKSIDTEFYSKFEELRTEIDKLDGELLQILASRLKIIDEIGQFKKENHITILQMKRWVGILEDRMAQGTHLGLKKEFLQSLLALIHEEPIQRQSDIFTGTKKKKRR
jgi:chorismate mutase